LVGAGVVVGAPNPPVVWEAPFLWHKNMRAQKLFQTLKAAF